MARRDRGVMGINQDQSSREDYHPYLDPYLDLNLGQCKIGLSTRGMLEGILEKRPWEKKKPFVGNLEEKKKTPM